MTTLTPRYKNEEKPIGAMVNTPAGSTFTISTALFTLYNSQSTPLSGLSGVDCSFPSGAQTNPQVTFDLDLGANNVPPGVYTGEFVIAGTGSDGYAREMTIEFILGDLTVLDNTAWEYAVPNVPDQGLPVNVVLSTYGDPFHNQSNIYNYTPPGMAYDAAGNRLTETVFINPLADNSGNNGTLFGFDDAFPPNLTGEIIYQHNRAFQYNSLNELMSDSSSGTAGSQTEDTSPPQQLPALGDIYSYGFQYDPVGNPTTFRSNTYPGTPYDSDNQLSISGLGYDANGNTTNFGGAQATYDQEDRLTSMPYSYNGQNGTFDAGYYASTGLRLYKDGANGRTYFVYDGDEPVEELDSNGNVIATNVYGPTGLLARYDASVLVPSEGQAGPQYVGNTFYYTYDPQGNVVQRLVSRISAYAPSESNDGYLPNGLVPLDTMYFDAFGAKQWDIDLWSGQQETYQDPFGYGAQWGYYTDNETGLVLMGHRYYAYGNGHFLTRDPIGTAGGINLYGFVGNNPVNGIDPNGTSKVGDFLLGAGDALNPVNWFKGSYQFGCAIGNVMLGKLSAKKLGSSMVKGTEFWNQPTARAAGRSFTGDALVIALSSSAVTLRVAAIPAEDTSALAAMRFSQVTASPGFSDEGYFANMTIGQMASALRSGAMKPSQIPVGFVVSETGARLIVNTRSALSLTRAGIPVDKWVLIDETEDYLTQMRIAQRLAKNGLTADGTDTLRITGAGSTASSLR